MRGRIFKIGLVSIITIWILILGAIIWHCNSIISSMVNGRIEDKNGKKLLKKYDREIDKVETKTSDGIKLSAWRFKTNNPKGIVIILHGMQGMDGGSLLDFGKFFKEEGYDAFLLDMRAHGYSSGDEIGLGYTEVRDVNSLLDWIKTKEEYKNKKIIVYGLSMGGSTAINAAAARKDIDVVISVSAYESFESQIIDYMIKANIPKAVINIYKPCFRLVLLLKYHEYLQELMTNYFADGKWEKKIIQIDALISDYVKNDNTAFCTFEEYNTAVEAFKTLGNLRYQSVQGQLNGTITSTTAEQTANPDKLISAGNLKLSSLGSMMGGGNHGGFGDPPTDQNNQQGDKNFDPNQAPNMPDPELMMQAMQSLQDAGGSITDEMKSKLLELGLTEEQISMMSQMKDGFQQGPGGNMRNSDKNNTNITPDKNNTSSPFRGQTINRTNTTKSLLIYSGLFAFVLIATFFVARKKRNY